MPSVNSLAKKSEDLGMSLHESCSCWKLQLCSIQSLAAMEHHRQAEAQKLNLPLN